METKSERKYFIFHTFDDFYHYDQIETFISRSPGPLRENQTVFIDEPSNFEDEALKEKIEKRIESSDCLIVPLPVRESSIGWLRFELEMAKMHGTPIIVVADNNDIKRIEYSFVKENANEIVDWNYNKLIKSMERMADKKHFESRE